MSASPQHVAGEQTTPAITLDHASFGYAGLPFTEEVSLTISQGEVVAILGHNGSGKSTLVRGLLGLTDHLGGEVTILGSRLGDLPDRSRIGYVPQRHTLSSSVRSTVREVIATGQLARRPWWRRAGREDRALVHRVADTVGLADRLDSDAATLSGGQQRRVLIARALASQPEVLIMDEPTAGVDVANQEVLATVLRRLAGLGVTMLVVTHELSALRGIVDRIIEMDGGRVGFDGTPAAYAERQLAASLAADSALAQAGLAQAGSAQPGSAQAGLAHSGTDQSDDCSEHVHSGPPEDVGVFGGMGPFDDARAGRTEP